MNRKGRKERKGVLVRVLGRDRALVNRWLARALGFGPEVPKRLAEAMRYAVLGPGKRIRPILCLETYRAVKGQGPRPKAQGPSEVAPFCCGIEMIHAFSLAHDDLPAMDNDDFRRGRPSLHRRYDEATAILAADALLALAFESFALCPAPAGRRLAASAELARAIGPAGMAGGQMMDIQGPRPKAQDPRLKGRGPRAKTQDPGTAGKGSRRLARVHRLKTAEFIAASLVSGATVAGARAVTLSRLRTAGRVLGRLFQVTDDMLDEVRMTRPDRRRAREDAVSLAGQAETLFQSLGSRYSLLAAFPQMILERTE